MSAPPASDFFAVVERCTACWSFDPRPVPEEALERILAAATKGPSGGNLQPWRFLVVRDPATRTRIANLYQRAWQRYEHATRRLAKGVLGRAGERALATGAHLADTLAAVPVHVVVCAVNWPTALLRADAELHRMEDRGAIYTSILPAVQNLMLAATALGLATRLTTLHKLHEDELRRLLGIPDVVETVALLPVGYPAVTARRRPRHALRRVVFYDRWERRGAATAVRTRAADTAPDGATGAPRLGGR